MTPALATAAAVLLATGWTDPTGRVRCDVPDTYAPLPSLPWRFARADGLRQLVFLTVKPQPIAPAERAKQLLERSGASAITVSGASAAQGQLVEAPPLAAAFAISALEPTWAGVLVLGPPVAEVAKEAAALAATCRLLTPAVASGRVFDTTRRLSAAIPLGHEANEVRGAGTVQGQGYSIRMTAVLPKTKESLQELAIEALQPSGARLTGTSGAAAGLGDLPVVIASGTLTQNGAEYVLEIAVIDLGNGEIGGLGMSTSTMTAARAREVLDEMMRTVTLAPQP